MTREETIEDLRYLLDFDDYGSIHSESILLAIKSLEAWDKVIEEIEGQRDFNIECDGESDLGMAIQIIKKHLGEVEENV
jgi:hypothetical protein